MISHLVTDCQFDEGKHPVLIMKCVNQFGILGSEASSLISSHYLVQIISTFDHSTVDTADVSELNPEDIIKLCKCLQLFNTSQKTTSSLFF